jgi:hypothetical protein
MSASHSLFKCTGNGRQAIMETWRQLFYKVFLIGHWNQHFSPVSLFFISTFFHCPEANGTILVTSRFNELQQTLKPNSFISISSFKDSIMDTLTGSCGCLAWCIVVSTLLPWQLWLLSVMYCCDVLLSLPCCPGSCGCLAWCIVVMYCCLYLVALAVVAA